MEGRDGRTEKATGKRRREARDKGQVARSHDLNSAVGLAAVFSVIMIGAPGMMSQLENLLASSLSTSGDTSAISSAKLQPLVLSSLESFARIVAPVLFAAAIVGVAVNVVQVGFKWHSQALRPKFNMLNPTNGFKRVFGKSGLVETGKALVKLTVIGGTAFLAVSSQLPQFASKVGLPPNKLMGQIGGQVQSLVFKVLPALFILAAVDMVWQRRRLAKSLMMSKTEVKQEARQTDIAPEVRGQLRKRQFQQSRRRMLAAVPTADVVIVNPTHYAIALRYDGKQPAPEVVAKGVDYIAAAIRASAEEHDVPIVENPPLARTLYRDVELGTLIPEALFVAVAQVLAFVYRTAGARGRARRRQAAAAARNRG